MTDKTYAYFPGCSADSTGSSYTMSMNYVANKIGLTFVEIKDWCCCGTSAAKVTNDDLSHALPARSLALSESQNPGLDVVASCAGCYSSLKSAEMYARESEENRAHLSDLIEMDYQATADVKSLLEIMVQKDMVDDVVAKLKHTLGGMKLACYYGCVLVRPPQVNAFDSVENPTSMEGLLNAAGAECIDWSFKTECCGASNHVVSPKAARKPVERILHNAKACGAEAIVTACPLCWLNVDMREQQVNGEFNTNYDLPVYYFTELLAYAIGATAEEAGLTKHFMPATDYVSSHIDNAPAPEKEGVA